MERDEVKGQELNRIMAMLKKTEFKPDDILWMDSGIGWRDGKLYEKRDGGIYESLGGGI